METKWSVRPQTVYVRGDLKLEFRARRMDQPGQHYTLDVVQGDRAHRVHFSPTGDVLRVEQLPFSPDACTV